MKTAVLVICLLSCVSIAAPIWVSGDVTFQSKYIWRGAVFNDRAVLQPWVAVGTDAAAITLWGNMDLTDQNSWLEDGEVQDPTGKFTEIDLILNYTHVLGPVSLTVGFNKYWYPSTSYSETAASEITFAAGYDAILAPTVTFAYSLEDAEGLYTGLGISHYTGLSETASAGAWVNLGYGDEKHNGYYYGVPEAGLADLTVGVSAPVAFPCGLTATPMVEYASLLKSEIADVFAEPSNLRGGLSLTYSFL